MKGVDQSGRVIDSGAMYKTIFAANIARLGMRILLMIAYVVAMYLFLVKIFVEEGLNKIDRDLMTPQELAMFNCILGLAGMILFTFVLRRRKI